VKEPTYQHRDPKSWLIPTKTPVETRLQVETLDFVKKVEKAEEEV